MKGLYLVSQFKIRRDESVQLRDVLLHHSLHGLSEQKVQMDNGVMYGSICILVEF